MNITLIGTSHLDLDGYNRSKKLLNYLKPSAIGIEDTEEGYKESKEIVKIFSDPVAVEKAAQKIKGNIKAANIETLRLLLPTLDYDTRAVAEYYDTNNVLIIFCEYPEEIKRYTDSLKNHKNLDELMDDFNKFVILTPEEARNDIKRSYSKKAYHVSDLPELVQFYSKRDKFAESVLRQQDGNIVYICGLDHIFGDYYPNLYDRLVDLSPERIKLNLADKL